MIVPNSEVGTGPKVRFTIARMQNYGYVSSFRSGWNYERLFAPSSTSIGYIVVNNSMDPQVDKVVESSHMENSIENLLWARMQGRQPKRNACKEGDKQKKKKTLFTHFQRRGAIACRECDIDVQVIQNNV